MFELLSDTLLTCDILWKRTSTTFVHNMCELQKISQPHNAHCLKYFVLLFKENYSCWVDYWLTGYHLKMLNFFIQSQINFKAISFCFLLKPQKILKWFFSENYLINFVLLCLQFYDYYYMHLLNPQLSKRWKEMPDAGLSKEYNADMVWNPKDTALWFEAPTCIK